MKNAIARRYAQAFFRLVRQEDLTAAQTAYTPCLRG